MDAPLDGASTITDWHTDAVNWDVSHGEGAPDSHHARVARFIQYNTIPVVIADHMGEPTEHMLTKLGVDVQLGASGNARVAVTPS